VVPGKSRKEHRGANQTSQLVSGTTVVTRDDDDDEPEVDAALKNMGVSKKNAAPSLIKGIRDAIHISTSGGAMPSGSERVQSATGALVASAGTSSGTGPKFTFSGSGEMVIRRLMEQFPRAVFSIELQDTDELLIHGIITVSKDGHLPVAVASSTQQDANL
jgi:hypothetical protein